MGRGDTVHEEKDCLSDSFSRNKILQTPNSTAGVHQPSIKAESQVFQPKCWLSPNEEWTHLSFILQILQMDKIRHQGWMISTFNWGKPGFARASMGRVHKEEKTYQRAPWPVSQVWQGLQGLVLGSSWIERGLGIAPPDCHRHGNLVACSKNLQFSLPGSG